MNNNWIAYAAYLNVLMALTKRMLELCKTEKEVREITTPVLKILKEYQKREWAKNNSGAFLYSFEENITALVNDVDRLWVDRKR